jgi:uncharacterized protein (DUF2164 family)
MALTLPDEARKHALASLKRFWSESFDAELSELRSIALLEFFLKEIAPSVYNAGVADAQAYIRDRVADLEGSCYEAEFAYWPKSASARRPR